MLPLAPVLLLLVGGSWAFVPVGETQGNFRPSSWTAPTPEVQSQAEGRSYGGARLKHGYGHHKSGHHKVDLGLDPGKIVLKCKVQEPLEHIVWIRQKCPNDHYDGGSLVAEGATVQDKSLYDVRILGGNSSITSELQLKKPLDPASAGFFRCEAWPHGGGGISFGQNVAQDVYVIGGQEMLRRCFGGWDEGGGHHPHDTWAKHRSNEPPAAAATASQQSTQHHREVPQYPQYQQPQFTHSYVPRYNYSDLRHAGSHEAPEVVVGLRQRKDPETTTAAPALLTRTGPYRPPLQQQQNSLMEQQQQMRLQQLQLIQQQKQQQLLLQQQQQQQQQQQPQPVATTTTEQPASQLPPRSYIAAATPQPLTPAFVPSTPLFMQPQQQQQQQQQRLQKNEDAQSSNNSSSSQWDIEDMMKGYPYRKGKAATTEKVFVVTPEPSTAA